MGVVPGKVEPFVRNCLWGIIVDLFSYYLGLWVGIAIGFFVRPYIKRDHDGSEKREAGND